MKDSGKTISTTVVVNFIMPAVIFMKESLSMIWPKVLVFTDMPTAVNMSDIGTKINNTVLVKKSGTTAVSTKDSIKMHLKRDKVSTAGQTVTASSANGVSTCLTVRASSYGMMIVCSLAIGKII